MNSIDRKPAVHQLVHVAERSQPDGAAQTSLQQRCIQARGNEVGRIHDQDLVRQVACSFTAGPYEPELARVAVQHRQPRIVPKRRKRKEDRPDPNAAMGSMQPAAPLRRVDTIKNHGQTRGERGSIQSRTSPVGPSVHDERPAVVTRVGRDRTRSVKHVMPVAAAALPSVPTSHAVEISQRRDRAAVLGDDRAASKGGVKPESALEPLDARAQHSLTHAGMSPAHPLDGIRTRSATAQPAEVRSPEPNLRGEPFQPRPAEYMSHAHPASNGDIKREGARDPLDGRIEPALTHADMSPAPAFSDGQPRSAAGHHAEVRSPMPNAVPNDHGTSSQPHPVRHLGDVLPVSKADMKPKGVRERADVGTNHAFAQVGTQSVHPLSASPLRSAEPQHTGARLPVPEGQGKPSEFDDEVPAVIRSSSMATRTIHYDFKTWVGQPGVEVRANPESATRGVTVSTSDDAVAQVLERRANELSAPVVKVRRDGDDEEPSRRHRVQLLQEDD